MVAGWVLMLDAVTAPSNADVAEPDPNRFVTVTTARTEVERSAFWSTYVCVFTPPIAAHELESLHRYHRYAYVRPLEGVQLPLETVAAEPTVAVPVTAGGAVAVGAQRPA